MSGYGDPPEGKPFKKGDPRINRNGRPKSFNGLRELARTIADEKAKSGNNTLVIDGHSITVVEAILRSWAMGKDKRKQQAFIEIAYGKVPQAVDITTGGDKINNDDPERIDRAISTFADAIGEIISRKGTAEQGTVDATERTPVDGALIES